jgi:peptidoglycan/LPS O-acetylase OafA/YrhL
VDLFFAISGLLICSRLLDEERLTRAISLRGFYIRRFFRILPAAFLYLVSIAIVGAVGLIPLHLLDWLGAALFFRNYVIPTREGWYTGHFWSLSVEEHFYLLIPGLLVLVRRNRIKLLLSLTALVILWRVFLHLHVAAGNENMRTDTMISFLLIPAMFAIALQQPSMREMLLHWTKGWQFYLVATLVFVIFAQYVSDHAWPSRGFVSTILTPIVEPVLLSLLLLSTMLHPENMLSRILELPWMRFVGRISFSLYLWQQPFFQGHLGTSASRSFFSELPWAARVLITLACAYASYRFVERPMIRMGHKLSPPATSGRDDLAEHIS